MPFSPKLSCPCSRMVGLTLRNEKASICRKQLRQSKRWRFIGPFPDHRLNRTGIMKMKNLFFAPALIAMLNLIPAGRVTAQSFTTLHSFTATSTNSSGIYTNSDGAGPVAGLITNSSGNTLYGTTVNGGGGGWGTVFAVNTDGTGFTNLHSFNYSDGANPWAGLILSGHTLYGTTYYGG